MNETDQETSDHTHSVKRHVIVGNERYGFYDWEVS